jgi:hypothetical protein
VRPGPDALPRARKRCAALGVEDHIDEVFRLAGVSAVVMTNDPFDDEERSAWERGAHRDGRFLPALRIDVLLNTWPQASAKLQSLGFRASGGSEGPDSAGAAEVRRFLGEWADRMHPVYMAVSLPPEFDYPTGDARGRVLDQCVLPFALERGLPLALMIGARKQLNPALRLAGDGLGRSRVEAAETLCLKWPEVRFLLTMLSRENQHQLCVAARKFANLLPFGCWWFLNDPSIIAMMTAQRLELLGTGFVPQHSDARVLDQLVYKWKHSREIIGGVLADKFADLFKAGWPVTRQEIHREVDRLFSGNFKKWVRA